MRPYLAIIKDSFRAAWASKVLYVLLGLIILILLLLSPFHMRESLDTRIRVGEGKDVDNPIFVVDRINSDKDDDDNPGMQRIWEKLPDDLKQRITKLEQNEGESDEPDSDVSDSDEPPQAEPEIEDDEDEFRSGRRGRRGRRRNRGRGPSDLERLGVGSELVESLNQLISEDDFYRKEDWEYLSHGSEASQLTENHSNLTAERKQRLNRILISEAFGATIKSGSRTALNFFYGWYEIEFLSTNQTQQQFASTLTTELPWYLDKIVLSIGLLIAILVSANIVPQTFEPGTLNLLLSKPISRAGLFLAKFAGGCAFILLCSAVLFVGVWLWMGIGLKVWDRAILFSIPLYVLVFAIYFSVSSFVGLTTRSTILAVIVTGVFWALCFGTGVAYNFFDNRMEGIEIANLFKNDDQIYQSDPVGNFKVWNPTEGEWKDAPTPKMDDEEQMARAFVSYISTDGLPKSMGPVRTADGEVLTSRYLITNQTTFNRQILLSSKDGEAFVEKGRCPRDAIALLPAREGLVAITRRGEFWKYDPELVEKKDDADATKTSKKAPDPFVSIGPKTKKTIINRSLIDLNWSNSEIAVYDRSNLFIYRPDAESGQYQLHRSIEVDTGSKPGMSCRIAYQGNTILLVLGNGQIISIDGETLKEKNGYLAENRVAADSVTASRDGRWFAVAYRNETLWLLDTENDQEIKRPNIKGQGTISAVSFDSSDRMLVADRTDRVTSWNLADLSSEQTWSPSGSTMDKIWRWGVKPLYTIFPKPGEFYRVVTHLSNSNDTSQNPDVDLASKTETKNPWSPLLSGINFMAIMLLCSCLWFWRSDY